jgi:zinc transport system ATP-binding protein
MSDAHALHPHPADKEIAVRFDSVSFSYGSVQVLENASFHIHRGEFVAMVGPNGSGKTTALKLLFGLETPSAGKIELFGSVCGKNHLTKTNVAYVPQQPPADNMFPITVKGIVRMGLLRPFKGYSNEEAAIAEAMEQTGIADLAQRPYRSLSGGQKRRSLVARALAAKPDLLVLDEPTANMDSESENRLYETLGAYKGKTTILIVTHDTEFVTSLTDRVLCLGDGNRSVVQHRIESDAGANAGDFAHHGGGREVRVLHGENIPADDCFQ